MKFSGIIQNIILDLPTNFQPRLFTQPNHFLAFLAFKMAFFLAFYELDFLVRQSDTLFWIGFVYTITGVRLLKSPFYYCVSMAMARLKMTILAFDPKFLQYWDLMIGYVIPIQN